MATGDVLGERLAGPGIRALNIARVLGEHHEVRLVTTADSDLAEVEDWCDILIAQGWVLQGRAGRFSTEKLLVCDLYDPLHVETLEQARDDSPGQRSAAVTASVAVLNEQLVAGDFFMCASTRQREFWLGHLAALGRVNTATYDDDNTLQSLIDVVPFGIPAEPPRRQAPAVKGVVPGIGNDDLVILWGGGLYNWLDPVTVVEAVGRATRTVPNLRLYFLGAGHPSPAVPHMRVAAQARAVADGLGLTGSHVFFNDRWVEHTRLGDYLLDADVGVSAHRDHLEASLAYRARILDYLWAGLPVVSSQGDVLADLVAERGLGLTVAPGDPDSMASAFVALLGDAGRKARATCRANVAATAPHLVWESVLEPLVEYCANARPAADRPRSGAARPRRSARPPWRRHS